MNQRHLLRAALPLLVLVTGAVSIRASSARADAEPRAGGGAHPWRSVQAPSEVIALSDYLMQPPGGDGGDDLPDTTREKEPIVPPPGSNPPVLKQPGGGTVPDSVKSSPWNKAREESLRSSFPGMRSNTQETDAPRPGARRGVLGLHPLAILVGLIALDIFVVTVAGK